VASYGTAMTAGALRLIDTWKAERHTGTVDVFRDYNELVRTALTH
jgi:RNase P/RNase MRP subunit POP5